MFVVFYNLLHSFLIYFSPLSFHLFFSPSSINYNHRHSPAEDTKHEETTGHLLQSKSLLAFETLYLFQDIPHFHFKLHLEQREALFQEFLIKSYCYQEFSMVPPLPLKLNTIFLPTSVPLFLPKNTLLSSLPTQILRISKGHSNPTPPS